MFIIEFNYKSNFNETPNQKSLELYELIIKQILTYNNYYIVIIVITTMFKNILLLLV